MTTGMTTQRIRAGFNPIFRPVNSSRHRYRIIKGSAGSGKSVNVAQDYIIKLSDPRYQGANLLVVRKVEETNRDSTFAELQAAVYRLFGAAAPRAWIIRLNPLSMECVGTGNRIIFRGMKDQAQREKVKSIATKTGKLTWVWAEEATELEQEDVDILDDRLRGELPNPNLYYQITMTFNPVSASHWIKGRYFDVADPDVLTHHSTYRDNRFIDAAYYRRMERRAREDPEGYRVYGLGEWGELGGLVLTNYEVHDFPVAAESFDAVYYGQDFGYNHANAILGIGWRDGEVYVRSEIYCHEKDTTEIIALADAAGVDRRVMMWCDSAEPDRIRMWQRAGYRAEGVHKAPGSVGAQIDWLKGRKIHIHPSCTHTIKEIQQWKYTKDKTTGAYTEDPVPYMDDAMAALRYGVESLRRPEPKFVQVRGM